MAIEDISASMSQWFNDTFGFSEPLYGELIWSTILLVGFIIFGWIVENTFEHYFKKWASKTKTKIDDEILKNVKRPIYVLVIFFGIYLFILNISVLDQYVDTGIIDKIFLLIEILLIAYIYTRVTNVLIAWYAERREKKTKVSQHIIFVFRGVFNGIVYLIAFFVFMALAGIAISAIARIVVIAFILNLRLFRVLTKVHFALLILTIYYGSILFQSPPFIMSQVIIFQQFTCQDPFHQ